jgi:hypothetical protein
VTSTGLPFLLVPDGEAGLLDWSNRSATTSTGRERLGSLPPGIALPDPCAAAASDLLALLVPRLAPGRAGGRDTARLQAVGDFVKTLEIKG